VCPTSATGQYEFRDIAPGHYHLAADDNSNTYATTWWGNSVDLEYALPVAVMQNDGELKGFNIQLALSATQLSLNEHNSVSRYVDSTAVTWLLMDMNNVPVGTATQDSHGNMHVIGDVPPGKYKAVDSRTGAPADPVIVPERGPAYATRDNEGQTGRAGSGGSKATESITFAPNPAVQNCNFNLVLATNETVEIHIINASGIVIYSGTRTCSKGTNNLNLDITGLLPGRYYVMVRTANGNIHNGQLVKGAEPSKQ
jgi:hypothetical protein